MNLHAGRLADPAARRMVAAGRSRIACTAPDLRPSNVLLWARWPDGKPRAKRPAGSEFEIVFPREARRK